MQPNTGSSRTAALPLRAGVLCQKCAIIEKKSRPPLPQNHTVQLKYWLKEYAMKISERQEEL